MMRTKSQRLSVVAAVVVMGVSGLGVAPAQAAGAHHGSGYKISKTKQAAGAWIGSYTASGETVYRLQPTKKAKKSGYGAVVVDSNLNGSGKPSARKTARAAYVLSVYGARGTRDQHAAVDAVTYHLVKGKKWRIGKTKGKARINQTGAPSTVRSYAKQILSASSKMAGPYIVKAGAAKTTAGSTARVTATVTTTTGNPVASRPVTFSYKGGTATAYTDSKGVAVSSISGVTPGTTTYTATVEVPEWRLHVRQAVKRSSSDVAVAGVKTRVSGRGRVSASDGQTVSVRNSAGVIRTGQALAGTYSLSGGSGTRTITRQVHGPFASAATNCTAAVSNKTVTSAPGPGTWSLPSVAPGTSGYYRWYIYASANALTPAASTCGGVVRVQKQAAVAQLRPTGQTKKVTVDEKFNLGFTTSGFDRSETHTVTSRLYGPFTHEDNAACSAGKLVSGKTQAKNVTGNTTANQAAVVIGANANAGYYIWQTTLTNGELILGGTSSCGVIFNVVKK